MRGIDRWLLAGCVAALAACGEGEPVAAPPMMAAVPIPVPAGDPAVFRRAAYAVVRDSTGSELGTVRLTELPDELHITGTLISVGPGRYTLRIHDVGLCEPPFRTAGAERSGGGPDVSPNAQGLAVIDQRLPGATLDPLSDQNTASVVLHDRAVAGRRVACGPVTPP